MIDLIDVTVAKNALATLQHKRWGGCPVSENAWAQRMGELKVQDMGDVINYLVDRGEVARIANWNYPDVYHYRVIR